jgi:amino acid adenylation domain-containing protein
MNIAQFLLQLQAQDIKLWLEQDKLRYDAPKGKFTPELRQQIMHHKAEIIGYLQQVEQKYIDLLPVSREQDILLSFSQQRLWFLDKLDSKSTAYNIPYAIELQGKLDLNALQTAFSKIVHRHEILRTNFQWRNQQAVQIIHPDVKLDRFFTVINLDSPDIKTYLKEQASKVFDLEQDSLIRVLLVQTEQQIVLFINLHHIIADGWSMGILLRELSYFYANSTAELPALPIQYADFAHWQRQFLQDARLQQQLNYWQQNLAGIPTELDLPTDYPRPNVQSYNGAIEYFSLNAQVTARLNDLANNNQASLFMLLLAAWQILLSRHTGQNDIVVGSPSAGRQYQAVQDLIGFFINNLIIRTKLQPNANFLQVLQIVKEQVLNAYANQDLPFERLVAQLQPERDLSHTPIFQVMLVFHQHEPIQLPSLDNLIVKPITEIDIAASKFDLNLHLWLNEQNALCGKLYYNTDLFQSKTIKWILGHFYNLLRVLPSQASAKIAQLKLLNPEDKLCKPSIQPQNDFIPFLDSEIEQSIAQRFLQIVTKYPQKIAVKTDNYTWTYKILNQKINQVANHLLSLGSQEQRVGLLFAHDAPMLLGILGALKAGASYVPLYVEHPVERLRQIVLDAEMRILLVQTEYMQLAREIINNKVIILDLADISNNITEPNIYIQPSALAYLLYTSGSTGQPKAVMQNHRNVLFHIKNYTNNLHITAQDRLVQFATYSFDAGMIDSFAALLNGASLYPLDAKQLYPVDLITYLHKHNISIYHSTPTLYRHLMASVPGIKNKSALFKSIRIVILGGEAVTQTDVMAYKQYFPSHTIFINGIGQTESSFHLHYFIGKDTEINKHNVAVGCPLAKTEILLLDAEGNDVGLYGELAVKSQHVALGYWRKTVLTQTTFKSVGDNYYLLRTGDMARLTAHGYYEFLGRNDAQVKLRGFRIELGEIEALLSRHHRIKQAVIMLREDPEPRLVAYVVANNLLPDRIPYQISCLIETEIGTFTLQTEDISKYGIGIKGELPAQLNLHTDLRIGLALPLDDQVRWFAAKVAWRDKQNMGLKLNLTIAQADLLQRNITYLIEKNGLLKIAQRILTQELREYLSPKLPAYMLPSHYVLLDAMPLTSTGKIARRALPLPSFGTSNNRPTNPIETQLLQIWQQLLHNPNIGINDNFFDLGGHSLLMIELATEIERVFQQRLPLIALFQAPSIASLAQYLQGSLVRELPAAVFPMQTQGTKPPFFCVAGAGGGVHWFSELAKLLAPDQPFYALETIGLEPLPKIKNKNRSQVQAMEFVNIIRQIQPQGPYFIGGYSYGGIVAHEMACYLQELGEQTALLVFLDSWNPAAMVSYHIRVLRWLKYFYRLPMQFKLPFLRTEIKKTINWRYKQLLLLLRGHGELTKLRNLDASNWRYALSHYVTENKVILFRSAGMNIIAPKDEYYGWCDLIDADIKVQIIPGDHYQMLNQPHVQELAKLLRECLEDRG